MNPNPAPPPGSIPRNHLLRVAIVAGGLAGCGVALSVLGPAWGLPPTALIALTILVVAATLWITEIVPLHVTSFVILFLSLVWLEPVMEGAELPVVKGAFLAPFFSDIILLFLGGFVLSAALHKYRLDEQMARWIIRRTGDTLPRLMLGIMLITTFLSMWLSNTATAAMMLALVLPIVDGLPKGIPARKALVLAVPFSANAGGLGTPIGSPPNAIAMQYLQDLGLAPSFGRWMLAGVPAALLITLLAWGLLVVLFRARGPLDELGSERIELRYDPGLWLVIAGSLLTVIGWMTTPWHGLSSGTVALVPIILFFGSGVLNVRDLRSLSWDVLLVMGGGLCLGSVIATSGLASWVVGNLQAESLGLASVLILFGVLACVMSCVMSNTATANLILPIALGLSIEPLSPVLLTVAFCCSLAMALPISTPPNAMAFSSDQIGVGDLARPGVILTAIGIALVFLLGYWWWDLTGIF